MRELLNNTSKRQLEVGDQVEIRGRRYKIKRTWLTNDGDHSIGVFLDGKFKDSWHIDSDYYSFDMDESIPIYKLTEETTMNKQFTKADLKTGMVIEQRNGEKAMVLLGTANGDIMSGQTWRPLGCINDDLSHPSTCGEYDIVKVYQPESNQDYLGLDSIWDQYNIIWEREAPKSKEQIAYDEALEATKVAKEAYELAQKKLEALNPANN